MSSFCGVGAAPERGWGTGLGGPDGKLGTGGRNNARRRFFERLFSGTSGALVMSFIAMSIVFLVIIGLMMVMLGTNRLVGSFDKKSSEAK